MTDEVVDGLPPEGEVNQHLSLLVGDGKKFRTAEDLARSKFEADKFIDKLKQENDSLRQLIKTEERTANVTDALQKILSAVTQPEDKTPVTNPDPAATPEGNPPLEVSKGVSAEDVVKIVHALEEQRRGQRNREQVLADLTKKYKDKTEEVIASRAAELGMTAKMLGDMAASNPKAFLRLIGEDSQQPNLTSNGNSSIPSRNSAVVGNTKTGGVRDAAYYEKLKGEMGAKKFVMDSRLQVQMHRDMQDLGDRWDATG